MTSARFDRLIAEISEQPNVVSRLLARQREAVHKVAAAIREHEPSAIVMVARGSSDNASVYGRYLFEVHNRQLTSLAAPSGLTLYGRGPRLGRAVVIGVSQSGQGEDVVAYVDEARRQGAVTVAIVNDESSPLAQTADHVLACLAGPELSVAATKTVTAQMTLLAMLSTELGPADTSASDALPFGGLGALPEALGAALEQRSSAATVATFLAPTTLSSVIGRGLAFPAALEIALKLKETSYTRAEPFSAADFLHGPVALVEPGSSALVIDVGGRSSASAVEIGQAIRERGGQPALLRVAERQHTNRAAGLPPVVFVTAPLGEAIAPIAALVLGQLVAVELALARGIDPSGTRGLSKVTSTR